MQLNKTIALRMTNEDQETLKQLANSKGMMFATYCRYILLKNIKENENNK